MTAAVLCTEETAACLIPHLISELETPCPCRRHDGLYLTGTSIDGRQVSITVKKGVLEVEGISQEELDALADWGIPCTASTFVVRSALPERVELEQRPQRELGRDAQQQQRVQRQQRRPPGFGGIYRDQVDPAAAGQPRADETETAEVQGHVRERSHHQGENHRELPELAVTRFPRRLPRAHTEIRPTLQ